MSEAVKQLKTMVVDHFARECHGFVDLPNGFEFRISRPQSVSLAFMKALCAGPGQDVVVRGEGADLIVQVLLTKDAELDLEWNRMKSERSVRAVHIMDDSEFNNFVLNVSTNLLVDQTKPMKAFQLNPKPNLRMEVPVIVEDGTRVSVYHLMAIQSQHVSKSSFVVEFRLNESNEWRMCVVCTWSKNSAMAGKRMRN